MRYLVHREFIEHAREVFGTDGFIPLHEPRFWGHEKQYVLDAIDSTFVSSVGAYVDRFETMICGAVGAAHAIATVNGTSALHVALRLAGVEPGDEVLTQAVTFVATVNAVRYCDALPVFLDVDRDSLGLSPDALEAFLDRYAGHDDRGRCVDRRTGRRIGACVPMHTFGHPGRIDAIVAVCDRYGIAIVEDSAESIGSLYRGRATGTFGRMGIYSFNGNKTITCGGGGVIVTNDEELAKRAKHITTTAKVPHAYEFRHDELGYNYRMPNLNAALGCAQLEQLESFIERKRGLADDYARFFGNLGVDVVVEPPNARSNYWLNAIVLPDREARDEFLEATNAAGVMTRPLWNLMNTLPMFRGCTADGLDNSRWLAERVVNIPSSVPARHDQAADGGH